MAISNTSLSMHVFSKVTNDVTQRILPQHLFSSSLGITQQTPHTPSSSTGHLSSPVPNVTKFLA